MNHQLILTIEHEARVYGKLWCPYGGENAPYTAPCSIHDWDRDPGSKGDREWIPVGGCWVQLWFDEFGDVDLFEGKISLPPFDVDWDFEGSGEDMVLTSIKPSADPEVLPELERLKAELKEAYELLDDFTRFHNDPGVMALGWLYRNKP